MESRSTSKIAIGIDLGTSNSCVGVVLDGKVEIIADDQGDRTTPSYVAFITETAELVGEAAKEQQSSNPKNTVYGIKRLIGRKFDDAAVALDKDHWPFAVTADDNGKPMVKIDFEGGHKLYSPEEISSKILIRMKEIAEKYVGQEIKNAIVTTPAHFNDAQRSATMDAAKIAGLNVLRILNEPTAAALAYGFKGKGGDESKTVLVFDMGGGTFDVTILSMKGHQHNVIWTDGDTRLGGEDIDMLLVNHMVGAFRRTHGQDISTNEKAKRRLRTSCETAKRRLSVPDVTTTRLYLDSLFGGIDFKYTLTRAEFDDLCQGLFDETMNLVEECLRGASLDKKDIDEIDLVGGSTRVVKIHDLLKVKFPGKPLNMSINADEAVAYGAAVFAANLIGDESNEKIKDLCLVDVTAHSLGIKVEDGVMSFLIAANTSIPTDRTKIYSNSVDNQEIVAICIYEGEATDVYENNLLGTFELPIPPAPKGKMHVKVTFAIDPSGILHVSAVAAGNSNQIIITAYRNRMSQEEIERLAKDAERNRTESRKATDRATAINDLETLARDIQRPMLTSNVSEDVNSPLAANLLSKAVDTLERIKSGEFKEDECENMKKELGELHRAFLDEAAAGKGLPERSVQEDSDQKENKKSVNEDEGGEDHHEQADNDDSADAEDGGIIKNGNNDVEAGDHGSVIDPEKIIQDKERENGNSAEAEVESEDEGKGKSKNNKAEVIARGRGRGGRGRGKGKARGKDNSAEAEPEAEPEAEVESEGKGKGNKTGKVKARRGKDEDSEPTKKKLRNTQLK